MSAAGIAAAVQVVGGLVGAYGSLYAGRQQQSAYNREATLLNSKANEFEERNKYNIALQKREGIKLRGRQATALAGAGVSIEAGSSAYQFMEESAYELTQDIYAQMRASNYESYTLRQQAQESILAGAQARKLAKIGAAQSILSQAGNAASTSGALGK